MTERQEGEKWKDRKNKTENENQLALNFVAIQVLAPKTFRSAQHCTVILPSLVQSPH
jgi:hypothetical protein